LSEKRGITLLQNENVIGLIRDEKQNKKVRIQFDIFLLPGEVGVPTFSSQS
jgi:hypothetical protein